ncbi:exo-beta-N-acetylmuramidase NamZ domain-containing protein [Tautonia marina]|uniref:exo-beta-N-acetylmuramidase NamZ domain-containing protein n=1 Tax=Tautonia marina TaxID=2653855 RepID=UPI001260D801|nr:exo-beta-N-acetylmuramidase NamZ domain-containing protein [Tautonia marina]
MFSHCVLLVVGLTIGLSDSARLAEAPPESLGFDPEALNEVRTAVSEAVEEGAIPGAVVVVGRRGQIALAEAVGRRAVEPEAQEMTRDTVFDMASLTKPVATATAVMVLWERGEIDLDAPITTYLPELANHGKEAITVEMLLRHRAGLIPDNPIGDYQHGVEEAWRRINEIDLVGTPGEQFRYTDVGFLILGRLVERVSGTTLDQFVSENVFKPAEMHGSSFLPLEHGIDLDRIAPTEREGETWVRGVVHDPRSRAVGGVAGHAGLFSTADDLAVYAQTLLNEGKSPSGTRILAPPTVRAMIDAGDTPEGERRGLGWDLNTGYSAPKGERFGPSSFGHTGFTGTSIWIDPETETFVILLTSRLHPDGDKPSPTALRRRLATIVASAIIDGPTPPAPVEEGEVQCGIDVLEANGFAPLKEKRIGLITNHTGRTRDGRTTIDVLFEAEGIELVTLFSPEHGIRGLLDTNIDDSKDEQTGLPIYSLYGERRKPSPEQLEGLDALVFDIADIGTRFYTYVSTMGLAMEAAAEAGIPIFVLDRPNPIGGQAVQGPVRDDDLESFIAFHRVPVRHGMTIGELALMFNQEREINAELTVIPCQGWRRSFWFDQTGLLWVNPSPNMRSLTEALLYPGVGLLEATNLATGRGTDTPFERVGAPWIDPQRWARELNAEGIDGVRFVPIRFSPSERQYEGEDCGGVYLIIDDWESFDPIEAGIGLAVTLRRLYPDDWKPEALNRLMTNRAAYDAIVDGASVRAVQRTWARELRAFLAVRAKYLIYED